MHVECLQKSIDLINRRQEVDTVDRLVYRPTGLIGFNLLKKRAVITDLNFASLEADIESYNQDGRPYRQLSEDNVKELIKNIKLN